MIYDPFNSENAEFLFDPADSENEVFGINISLKRVQDDDIVFPRRKKRAVALIEFEFAQQTLQFGFHRPVIGRDKISPLVLNSDRECEVESPEKIALMISAKFGTPPHYSALILRVASSMASHSIDKFETDRHAKLVFGGGPVEFRDQGRPGPAEATDQPQP
ncbi:MAG: hypothetical protein M0Z99_21100 [Betaproteobacteria bacterium]|nr:hypothetical protein [Betaproteobacteria bacterium]